MPLVLGACLEQLMFPRADSLLAELPLDDLEALGNFLIIHGRAVAAQEKLGNIGWNWILSLEFAHKVLAHHITFKNFRGNCVDGI